MPPRARGTRPVLDIALSALLVISVAVFVALVTCPDWIASWIAIDPPHTALGVVGSAIFVLLAWLTRRSNEQ